jgi:hypothetical protein
MKPPLLTAQDIIARAQAREGRHWKNSFWTDAYRAKRRIEGVWVSVFLLLFVLFGGLLAGILMLAKYGPTVHQVPK